MVTASHNPPQDNGYKVYLGDGSQIVPPADAGIAAAIAASSGSPTSRARRDGWEMLGEQVLDALPGRGRSRRRPAQPARAGRGPHRAARGRRRGRARAPSRAAGFAAPDRSSRARPSPTRTFPTVAFPNPEEPGAIDAALALAAQVRRPTSSSPTTPTPTGARRRRSLGTRHPAAGGCCAATRSARCWARTSVAPRGGAGRDVFANSIVSSRLLAAMCGAPRGCATRRRSPGSSGSRGCRAALRLRGGARLLRRPGRRCGQGRRQRGPAARRAGGGAAAQGRTLVDRARRPRRRARGARHRRVLGAGGRPVPDRRGSWRGCAPTPPTTSAGVDVARTDDLARGRRAAPTEGLRYLLADDVAGHRAARAAPSPS